MLSMLPVVMALAMPVAAQAQPPKILQIYREPLKPGVEAEYDHIESDTARKCRKLHCPHAYLGMESLTGPKEIWWFNAYDSIAEEKQVKEAWAKNKAALTVLGRNGKRKAQLTERTINSFANYRADWSAGSPWLLGHARFLVITVTKDAPATNGTVYEGEDGTRYVFASAQDREEAGKALAASVTSRLFVLRPSWSYPAADWIAADPELWRASPPARTIKHRKQVANLVRQIQRADYAGDRTALKRLYEELAAFVDDTAVGVRVRYWRGFALWRRAINGFNDGVARPELQADLNHALDEFNAAAKQDPAFAHAKIGALGCASLIGYILIENGREIQDSAVQEMLAKIRQLNQEAKSPRRIRACSG